MSENEALPLELVPYVYPGHVLDVKAQFPYTPSTVLRSGIICMRTLAGDDRQPQYFRNKVASVCDELLVRFQLKARFN